MCRSSASALIVDTLFENQYCFFFSARYAVDCWAKDGGRGHAQS